MACAQIREQVGGRVDADIPRQQRRLELVERLIVEHPPAERSADRARQPGARYPETRLQPLGPGALRVAWRQIVRRRVGRRSVGRRRVGHRRGFLRGLAFEEIEHGDFAGRRAGRTLSNAHG